ncbi:MAG TPA: glycosyltransferase [Candidatus Kapabacteria bacterium]|nr:glycosyltransferase [Candidatus Kapabacteria bacterium]
MTKKIRLTYFINDMIMGGAENLLWNVVNALDHSLFACTVVHMFGKNEFDQHGPVIYVGLGLEPRRIYKRIDPLWKIWSYFATNRCDILHTHLCYADTYGQFVGTLQNIPLMYSTIHNIVEWPREHRNVRTAIEDYLLQRTTRVIAVGNTLKDEIVVERRCPPQKITMLYNGIDLEPFVRAREHRQETRAELGMKPDAPLVLCTAQFRKEKRHDLLLPAFELLLKQMPDAKLLLVGSSGELKDRVIAWIAERHLEDSILIRAGDRNDVARYCGAADMFTMHSQYEGFSIALNEAMASSLPVAAPRIPVFIEGVRHGIDGYLFSFGDPQAHAEAMIALWNDIKNQNIFWRETASRVQEQFSIQMHVKNLTRIYLDDLKFKRNFIRQ